MPIPSPWKEAILYVIKPSSVKDREHYDDIFNKQFTNLKEHKDLPLREFIEELCDKFKRYQRHVDGEYQIIPREKQKRFLERIITGEECFHFSEVGSGKTKGEFEVSCVHVSPDLFLETHAIGSSYYALVVPNFPVQ